MSAHDEDHHHPAPLSPVEVRARALEELLKKKGLVDEGFIDAVVNTYEHDIGPMNGARVVARAWVDQAYKARLLANGTAAIAELGSGGPEGEHLVVVENTPSVHNVVVCTLCSCYPWPVLGLPPNWYKSPPTAPASSGATRAPARDGTEPPGERRNPRVGLECGDPVHGAPRASDRDGGIREEALAALATRDSMIGTAQL